MMIQHTYVQRKYLPFPTFCSSFITQSASQSDYTSPSLPLPSSPLLPLPLQLKSLHHVSVSSEKMHQLFHVTRDLAMFAVWIGKINLE
jgi:hypothetical protein